MSPIDYMAFRRLTLNLGYINKSFPASIVCPESSHKTGRITCRGCHSLPPPEEKDDFVRKVFSNVAPKYDLMNDLMSGYFHRCWKHYMIESINPIKGTNMIDVAGGTGDIAFKFLERTRLKNDLLSNVTVVDINEDMLNTGKQRSQRILPQSDLDRLTWNVGDAQQLPFEDGSFHLYTIAYGIRNVADIEKALQEAYRTIKSGGLFVCLEFSKVTNPLLLKPYEKYLLEVIPIMGELVVGDYKSYKYLAESILNFPNQEDFKQMIKSAGFTYVAYENLFQGISAIHYGYKR